MQNVTYIHTYSTYIYILVFTTMEIGILFSEILKSRKGTAKYIINFSYSLYFLIYILSKLTFLVFLTSYLWTIRTFCPLYHVSCIQKTFFFVLFKSSANSLLLFVNFSAFHIPILQLISILRIRAQILPKYCSFSSVLSIHNCRNDLHI